MSHGPDYIEGWPAVAWVAGIGAASLLGSAILRLAARGHPARVDASETYRAEQTRGDSIGDHRRALALLLFVQAILSQLLYVWMYVELAYWSRGDRQPPRVFVHNLFWVALVCGTVVLGALFTGLKRDPR
jgi:hypothetical protein